MMYWRTLLKMLNDYDFEVGVVYRSDAYGRYYLAVDKNSLITIVGDITLECNRLRGSYSVVRNISVEGLCSIWKIPIGRLDEMSKRYFVPVRNNKTGRRLPDRFKTKQNTSQDSLTAIWARHRLHRIGS